MSSFGVLADTDYIITIDRAWMLGRRLRLDHRANFRFLNQNFGFNAANQLSFRNRGVTGTAFFVQFTSDQAFEMTALLRQRYFIPDAAPPSNPEPQPDPGVEPVRADIDDQILECDNV